MTLKTEVIMEHTISELSRSGGHEQLPDISEDLVFSEDQESVNFNFTATTPGMEIGLAPFSQSAKSQSAKYDKEFIQSTLQQEPHNSSAKVLKNMETSMASALSRGSGMSSGNFCLAADNIFSMNEKVSTIEKLNTKLESDKQRLSSQLNQMLSKFKDLQIKYDIQLKIKEKDEEGL